MKRLTLVGTLALAIIGSSGFAYGQSTNAWITSISYEQNTAGNPSTMDVHVGVLQIGDSGYPCSTGNTLVLDPLSIRNVTFSGADGPNPNPGPLTAKPESGGFVYHVPVGINLDLPNGWQTFTLQVQAHCSGATQFQQSPSMTVRRYAMTVPLQVSIVGGQPQWNRSGTGSGGQDSLSFTIQSNRPVAIQNLLIKDVLSPFNAFTEAYNDPVEATRHNITLPTDPQLQGRRQYNYVLQFTEGGLPLEPVQLLSPISTPAAPTRDYALVQLPTTDQLTIRDESQPVSFTAQTSDPGSLSIVFDALKINESDTLNGTRAPDGLTHTFTIPANAIATDGQYSFHFTGVRDGAAPANLSNAHESLLVVATRTQLISPVGLGLSSDSQSIVVTYCLSKPVPNQVIITNNPSTFSVTAPGNKMTDEKEGCRSGTTSYTASLPLSEFSTKVASTSQPTTAAAPPTTTSASGAPASDAAHSGGTTQLPIQLFIVDKSGADRNLASMNLAAVLVPKAVDTKAVTDALTTLSKNASDPAATSTLKNLGLSQPDIDSLVQVVKKRSNNPASAVGTVLATVGKVFLTAYLGIPAAPATGAK